MIDLLFMFKFTLIKHIESISLFVLSHLCEYCLHYYRAHAKKGHIAATWKRSHQWCVSLTPNNTKTIGRMTCHCFLRPIRRDLTSSSYTTHFLPPTEAAGRPFYVVIWATPRTVILCGHLSHTGRPFYVVIWATQDGHFMWSFEPHRTAILCGHLSHTGWPFYVVIWATQDGHFMWSSEPRT